MRSEFIFMSEGRGGRQMEGKAFSSEKKKQKTLASGVLGPISEFYMV
jgi:hypothetical protein